MATGPVEPEKWLTEIKKTFYVLDCSEKEKCNVLHKAGQQRGKVREESREKERARREEKDGEREENLKL